MTDKAEWGSVPKVDDIDRADIHVINKACQMKPGTYIVPHTRKDGSLYDIGVKITDEIQVTFQLENKKRRLKTDWDMEPVGFGTRPTFICPECGEDCKQLYPEPGGCRVCCGIRYRQTGRKWPNPDNMKTTAEIVALLGWTLNGEPVQKPKGMTQTKHKRFIERFNILAPAENEVNRQQRERAKYIKRYQEQQEDERRELARRYG